MRIDREKLKLACNQMQVPSFDENDYQFLVEYHKIIAPVAHAMKILEANRFTFGIYLPTLVGLRAKLADMRTDKFTHGLPLLDAISDGFETRFKEMLDIFDAKGTSTPLYIAMVTNPQYKLNFLGFKSIPRHISIQVQNMLMNAGKEVQEQDEETATPGVGANIEIGKCELGI